MRIWASVCSTKRFLSGFCTVTTPHEKDLLRTGGKELVGKGYSGLSMDWTAPVSCLSKWRQGIWGMSVLLG